MTTSNARRQSLIERLVRALLLDRSFYEEVAADRTALSQAIGVVILTGIVNGMGLQSLQGAVGAAIGITVSLVGWLLLSLIIFIIGARLLRTEPTPFRAVATCLGFADMPAMVNLFSALPGARALVHAGVWCWLFAATIVAARAAFNASLARGAAIGGLGFALYMLIGVLVGVWSS